MTGKRESDWFVSNPGDGIVGCGHPVRNLVWSWHKHFEWIATSNLRTECSSRLAYIGTAVPQVVEIVLQALCSTRVLAIPLLCDQHWA